MTFALEDFGSFHVGGRHVTTTDLAARLQSYTPDSPPREVDPNGAYWIEQAYVQFFIPLGAKARRPVVFLHGGGLTGVTWDRTPDGRAGWLHAFLRAGHPVFVVDQPERGRAGFCALPDRWHGVPISRPEHEAWTLFRFGDREGYETRTPFPGCDFPIEALTAFTMQFVPRWTTTRAAHIKAFRAVLERLGPCTVVCHSQGGDTAHAVLAERPDLIEALVSIEPSGFTPPPPDARLTGLRVLYVYGDYIEREPMWAHLDGVARDHVGRLRAAGADVTWLDLPAEGLRGATHMVMMDHASDRSASLVLDWLASDNRTSA